MHLVLTSRLVSVKGSERERSVRGNEANRNTGKRRTDKVW